MKPMLLTLLLGSVLFTGCASNYVITLAGGSQITVAGKPQLQNGVYHYTDTKGQPGQVPAGRVREVSPASMAGSALGYEPRSSP